jgi:hypothetical protein
MRTFAQFMSLCEASEPDVARKLGWGGGASVTRQGEGGKIGRERKKTAPEKRRMKAIGGGKFAPAKDYKPRKDIGQQRQRSEREQQPEQERGSAREKQLAAAKAERKKAAQARIAARKAGKTASTDAKPKAKEAEKTATQLLTKKKTQTVSPTYKPQAASGYSRDERRKLKRAGDRLIRDIRQGKEKPASHYDPSK